LSVFSQESNTKNNYAAQSVPFREGETRAAVNNSKLKENQIVSSLTSTKRLMTEVKNKTEGQQVIKEVDEYMKNYSILTRTRNIRKSIERETRKMKELCVLVLLCFLIFLFVKSPLFL
jgi:hypothetical protein